MEPREDNTRVSVCPKSTMQFSSSHRSADNLHSVQQIQTSKCKRRKSGTMMEETEHQCWDHSSSRTRCSRSACVSPSSSSFSLVLFLLTSALVLLTCVSPSHSLPFDGRSLSSNSNSQRSQMDLLIDPIHQAENGDEDPFENTRVVKSVFDMVLRTPPPPTSSSRCPPGTQSPFQGGPCVKKSTDPVAFVDQSFLLDTLRGLAQEGLLMPGAQKQRRPSGNNRRRPSGRPGSRTTSTTTAVPSTTLSSSEEMDEEASPSMTTFPSSSTPTGDSSNTIIMAEEKGEADQAVESSATQEPSTSPPLDTTLAPAIIEGEDVDASNKNEQTTLLNLSDGIASSSSGEMTPSPQPINPSEAAVTVTTTSTTPVTTTTTEAPAQAEADVTVTPENLAPSSSPSPMPVSASTSTESPATGNGKQSSPSSSSSDNAYISSFQFPFHPSSFVTHQPTAVRSSAPALGQRENYRHSTNPRSVNSFEESSSNYHNYYYGHSVPSYPYQRQVMAGPPGRRPQAGYNPSFYHNGRRSRRRMLRTL